MDRAATQNTSISSPPPAGNGVGRWHAAINARVMRNAVLVALLLLFLWLTIQVDFIIFAGILLAIFLRKLANLVCHYTGLPHGWSLAVVVVLIVVVAAGIGYFFSQSISSQIGQLSQQLPQAFHKFQQRLEQTGWGKMLVENVSPSTIVGPGQSSAAGTIFGVATSTIEIIGSFVVLVFVGLYAAAEPQAYLGGFLRLIPIPRRERMREILYETGDTLWYWMLGRLFSMTMIGLFTTLGLWIIGIPLPVALGLLAGILTFIPYLGTIMSALPTGLIALTIDPKLVLYVIALYIGVHTLEGYILVPLVQRKAAHLPPALTLSLQVIFGVLVGFIGLALATPLVAAGLVLTRMLYVEDVLGDRSVEQARYG